MVFGNSQPALAKVRFKVFKINYDHLENKNIIDEEVEGEEKLLTETSIPDPTPIPTLPTVEEEDLYMKESVDSDSDIDSDDLYYNYIVSFELNKSI